MQLALPSSCPRTLPSRSTRVASLVAAVMLMSLADLYMTLTFVTSVGMHESNPLARAMMSYGSPAVLVVWKLASVILGAGILLWARRKPAAEIGAWVCFLVLTWLMIRWMFYSDYMAAAVHALEVTRDDPASNFVAMVPP